MLGIITKMKTQLEDLVQYSLPIGDQELALNPLIGQTLSLVLNGRFEGLRDSACQPKLRQGYLACTCSFRTTWYSGGLA